MKSKIAHSDHLKIITYNWNKGDQRYLIEANFEAADRDMERGSHEQFIYEHYYGYTRVSGHETWEYKVNHPAWQSNQYVSHRLVCDFGALYGKSFAFLQYLQPHSVYNAKGSAVSIDWKVNKFVRAYIS